MAAMNIHLPGIEPSYRGGALTRIAAVHCGPPERLATCGAPRAQSARARKSECLWRTEELRVANVQTRHLSGMRAANGSMPVRLDVRLR